MEEWVKLGISQQDPVATDIMINGLKLDWKGALPPTFRSCPPSLVTRGRQELEILEFIPSWIAQGYVREISNPALTPCHFSRMFTVPKGTSERRPIIDLSPMNRLLKRRSFKMEDLRTVSRCLFPGLWAVKLDLKDAYLHLLLALAVIHFFAFALGKRQFMFLRMPFGLSPAPWAFTRILKPVKKSLRGSGINLSSFLDDFLIWAKSYEEAVRDTRQVILFLQKLGFHINWKKSALQPQRKLEYLGVIVDLEHMTFSLPKEKVEPILMICRSIQGPSILKRDLESILGF